MPSVTFRYRKTGRHVDASYSIAEDIMGKWMVGDTVAVCFSNVDAEIVETIKRQYFDDIHVSSDFVQVKCTVVFRHHSIVWKSLGRFEDLLSGVTLEALAGEWEDVLLWITTGERPEWANTRTN